jgi:DNA gyrase/topoisomerase IV subunit A
MRIAHLKNKEIYEIRKKLESENQEREKLLLKQELENKEKKFKEYYDEIKKLSDTYKTEKVNRINEEKVKKEKEEQEKKILVKQEVKTKLPIVLKRQRSANDHFIELYKQKELIREEKERQKTRLNTIIENLKVRPKVEVDPERVKQITEAMKIRYETGLDTADKVVLFQNNGFTVDNLMQDLRYKVSTALADAGLLYKDYSNHLLNQLSYNLKNN